MTSPTTVVVFDGNGRVCYEKNVTSIEKLISLDEFADGLYFINVSSNDARETFKVILNKNK